MKTKKRVSALLVSLLVFVLTLSLSMGFLSDWGSARVHRNVVLSDNGMQYSYLSYVPKNASADNPTPAVIVYHGNNDNAEGFSQWAVELVRRGYSVFIPDLSKVGMSDSGFEDRKGDEKIVLDLAKKVQALNFVDADHVVTTGHSKGGSYAYTVAHKAELAGAVAVSGMRADTNVAEEEYKSNLVTLIGTGDWMNQLDAMDERNIQYYASAYGEEYADGSLPEDGKEYGSIEDKSYRVLETFSGVFCQHPAARYNPKVIARVVYYIEKFAPTNTDLAPENQVIILYYLNTLLAVASMIAVLINLLLALIQLPFFASVKKEVPENIGRRGKDWFLSAALSMSPTVPLFILMPYLSEKYLNASTATKLFPVGTTNRFVLYFICIAIVESCLFYFRFYRKRNCNPQQIGYTWGTDKKENAVNIGKAFLLAAIVAGTGLTCLYILETVFGLSFTAWWMMVRAARLDRVFKSLMYIPIFFILFASMQFGANTTRRLPSTGNATKDMARDIVVNCLVSTLALTIFFFINMALNDHAIFWSVVDSVGHSYYMYNFMLIGNCATTINTVLFRKTGSVWPGLWLCTLLFGVLVPAGCPII